uniref:Uncharacterized protein n=1 Tax=Rhizophora mucronata TaxID=61149 RepID=A0A2P2M7F3_RHIMU
MKARYIMRKYTSYKGRMSGTTSKERMPNCILENKSNVHANENLLASSSI